MTKNKKRVSHRELNPEDRYNKLNERKIRAQKDLEYAEEELKKLQEEALSEYGTTDIQELKNILEEMEDKNQKLQSDYEDHLQKIETELAEIEENSKK